MFRRCQMFAVLALGIGAQGAFAQPVPSRGPSSTHIFPAGARRGTTVAVRVGAECLPPAANLFLYGKGIHAPAVLGAGITDVGQPAPRRKPTEVPISYPKEWSAKMEIAADAPLGPAFWRLGCAQGGTQTRPFLIGDLPEVIERESNSVLARAESVTLPVTLNGQIHGERDLDYFCFQAQGGDVVVCEVMARRIGSRLDPVVELLDTAGTPLDVQRVYVGSDPVLAARIVKSGDYYLRVANVSFRGDPAHVYRINLTRGGFTHFAFPPGGEAGTEQEIAFYRLTGETGWSVTRRQVRFPKQGTRFRFVDPVAAPAGIELQVTATKTTNDQVSQLVLPATVYGQFSTPTDADTFRFTAVKGQRYSFACRAFPPGMAALPTLQLTDQTGKSLALAKSVDRADGTCRIEWQASRDGEYHVHVRDLRYGAQGGADFLYRMSVGSAVPDARLTMGRDSVTILQGSEGEVAVDVERSGGFQGEIMLTAVDLPKGVQATPTKVGPQQKSGKLKLKVAKSTASFSFPIRIVGTMKLAGKEQTRIALASHLGRDAEGVSIGTPTLEQFFLSVKHTPVFRLFCSEAYLYGHRGSVFPYPMEVQRLGDFKGPIHLQTGDRQNRDLDGVRMLDFTVPPGQTDFFMPIYLPETMHINVQSQSQLYTQSFATFTDQHGRKQSVLVVSEKRNMLRTLPPVVKLSALDDRIALQPGTVMKCRLRLERTSNFPDAMQLALVDISEDSRVRVDPVTISAGATTVEVPLRVAAQLPRGKKIRLRFRARGKLDGRVEVITETVVIATTPS